MTSMAKDGRQAPAIVALYGWLGLIPFLAPPLAGWWFPAWAGVAAHLLVCYGALILSFLGGARWGLAVTHSRPDLRVVSLAMLPTLVALALVAMPGMAVGWRMGGLALAFAAHWIWDLTSTGLPSWYPQLRTPLSLGAVTGLFLGVILLQG
jgi:hypothetical protein